MVSPLCYYYTSILSKCSSNRQTSEAPSCKEKTITQWQLLDAMHGACIGRVTIVFSFCSLMFYYYYYYYYYFYYYYYY